MEDWYSVAPHTSLPQMHVWKKKMKKKTFIYLGYPIQVT